MPIYMLKTCELKDIPPMDVMLSKAVSSITWKRIAYERLKYGDLSSPQALVFEEIKPKKAQLPT